jgi:hypothetical protein
MIPFFISLDMHAFLGPTTDASNFTHKVKEIFHGFSSCHPRIFTKGPYEIGFMSSPSRVFRVAPYAENESYINWLIRVQSKWDNF